MNREQINKKIVQQRAGYDAYMKDAPEELATVDRAFYEALCNIALNSIPKAFDPEDETTWPENRDKIYTVWFKDGSFSQLYGIAEAWHEVTHFLPTPEAGESK